MCSPAVLSVFLVLWVSVVTVDVKAGVIGEVPKVKVQLYFDSLSSRTFIYTLISATKSDENFKYMDLQLIPFGKATLEKFPSKPPIVRCPEGEQQCELNALIACILETNEMRIALDGVVCLMHLNPYENCIRYSKLDVPAIDKCYEQPIGQILERYGDATNKMDLKQVPTIVINGRHDIYSYTQEEIRNNFCPLFRDEYYMKFGIWLSEFVC